MPNNQTFGYYDDDNREYVITTPYTPLPWINYLGNDGFYGLISNTAGGYCFYKDAKFRRLTRYRYNNVPMDTGGRYFYIKDGDTIWAPGGRPVDTELDQFECRHGLGYSQFNAAKNGLSASLTCMVPLGLHAESYNLKLTNDSNETKSIKLYSFLEWCLWNASDDGANFQRNLSTGEVEVEGSVIYHKTEYRERRNHYAFYAVNQEISGFDTSRDAFVGTYNSFANPQVVKTGKASNSLAAGWSPIASHELTLTLAPGETKELVFMLGYVEVEEQEKWEVHGKRLNKKPGLALFSKVDTQDKFDAALAQLKAYWQEKLAKFQIHTPDERFNRSINIWNQYQNMVTFNMSRSASYYESGIGRGMGFRDSHQDTIGFTHMAQAEVRERLLDLSATHKSDGSAYHQYQPLTKKGNADIGGNFNDDPMWMVLGTANYIKETGDWSILDAQVPFEDKPNEPATHFDHLTAAFNHVTNKLGPHQLPLIGRADWNDCLNLNCFSTDPNESFQTTENSQGDVAESLMIAGQFVLYGREYIAICEQLGHKDLADKASVAVEKMILAVEQHGWDGEWFLRAYDAFGKPVGSQANDEGKIFIESQGFCIMAGIGLDDGKAALALDSVEKYLSCDYGIVLQHPPFSLYRKELGEISSYPPGYKENAGIFCHNNPWMVIAAAMLNRPEQAMDYFQKITPAYLQEIQSLHKTEPYVYSQMVAGKDAVVPGEAKNSWLTGTSAWNFYAATQYILGITPDYAGLRITPCIPSEWQTFSATRQFREASYEIELVRSSAESNQVHYLEIDGEKIEGNLIPYEQFKGCHKVVVKLGETLA